MLAQEVAWAQLLETGAHLGSPIMDVSDQPPLIEPMAWSPTPVVLPPPVDPILIELVALRLEVTGLRADLASRTPAARWQRLRTRLLASTQRLWHRLSLWRIR